MTRIESIAGFTSDTDLNELIHHREFLTKFLVGTRLAEVIGETVKWMEKDVIPVVTIGSDGLAYALVRDESGTNHPVFPGFELSIMRWFCSSQSDNV